MGIFWYSRRIYLSMIHSQWFRYKLRWVTLLFVWEKVYSSQFWQKILNPIQSSFIHYVITKWKADIDHWMLPILPLNKIKTYGCSFCTFFALKFLLEKLGILLRYQSRNMSALIDTVRIQILHCISIYHKIYILYIVTVHGRFAKLC